MFHSRWYEEFSNHKLLAMLRVDTGGSKIKMKVNKEIEPRRSIYKLVVLIPALRESDS